ncbi:hypothetical protein [Vibrio atlanticus]|uniref:hypothetical protein n=1 Tax=Vibrio atlanticus TaxID=693153 RepID=UPI001428BDB0|nr:hypothetical protein [Vibrio atlanticus]
MRSQRLQTKRSQSKAIKPKANHNNPSFVSLYRNGNIFIDIEKRYCDAAQENSYHIGTQYLQKYNVAGG